MTRLLGYLANQSDRIRCALTLEEATLHFGAARADGWGVGSYQGSDVLLRRKPTEARDTVKLLDLVRDLRTTCAIAHVRTATVGARSLDNTHPFRYRHWLWAHNGTLPNFADARRKLTEEVPEHIARNVRGDTDSELAFHVFLAHVYRTGRLEDPDFDRASIAAALHETVQTIDRVCGPGAVLNVIVTNGQSMVALRRGSPMSWFKRQGVRDCAVCRKAPELTGREPRRVDHETFRYVLLASDEVIEAPGWRALPDSAHGACAAVDRNLDVQEIVF